jgi:transcriptional regulator with XRE-family HTH domain
MDGIGARLKALREKAGLDPEALADQVGISPAWFEDLEKDDEELENSLDLEQARKLSLLLGAGMAQLITGAPLPPGVAPLTFQDLARKLKARIDEEADPASGLEAWEEKTGWELGRFLKSPAQEGWGQRIRFFQDVGRALRIDWLGILAYCEALPEEI